MSPPVSTQAYPVPAVTMAAHGRVSLWMGSVWIADEYAAVSAVQDRTEPEEQQPEAVYYRGERPSGFLSRCVAPLAAKPLTLALARVLIVLLSRIYGHPP